ncbi:glycosyl hydrolase 53 family protein [Teredinibacter franksiae]|uniref:glycosyl hydrolase 53 family protein n=1 Tax=Teredinibacter franksiae TaxID=2761453 RepID=UPI0016251E9E|nr:glycosyl hydrolase 53 family protein [Teredinibacter franksiae]
MLRTAYFKTIAVLVTAILSFAIAFQAHAFTKGADVSWLTEMEANGYRFYDDNGTERDLFEILKEHGMDSIRLRVWVNPNGGWSGISDTIAKAQRAKAAGMRILIDFHYSDSWADPGQQTKPAAWANLSMEDLMSQVWWHTRDSLTAIKNAGITPEWVQVGNETNNGMLWDDGRASVNMQNYAWLTNSGYEAVKEVFPNAQVVVHLANCHDNANFRWIFDGLTNNGGKFDIIGASSYPMHSGLDWQTANNNCLSNLNDMVSRYDRDVMVVELGVPWDQPDAQDVVADVISKVRAVNNGRGLGVFYWEPQGQNFSGYTLGTWNPNTGRPTAALDAFLEGASGGGGSDSSGGTGLSEGRYAIISRFSGKALDVEGNSTSDGANLVQWSYGGGANQQFDIASLGDGTFSIRPAHSGKSLDVYGFSTENGGDIRQWSYLNGVNQRWRIEAVEDGYYKIVSVHSGKALDVYAWDSNNGANIAQWDDLGGTNQQWQFRRID